MPRRPQILGIDCSYHVTARSNNKEWFYLPLAEVWKITKGKLRIVTEDYSAQIIAFVLMSNHFHLLIQTPLANLDEILNYFIREVSRAIGRRSERINHVFGGRNKSTIIRDPYHLAHAYKYIYRNPVRAGIHRRVEDYPFSSLRLVLARSREVPIIDLDCNLSGRIPQSIGERIDWLNTPTPKEKEKLIRNGLRRVEFSFSRDRNVRHLVDELMRKV